MCVWSFPLKRSYRRILGTIERKTDVVTIMATGCPHNTIFQLHMLLFLLQISPGSVPGLGTGRWCCWFAISSNQPLWPELCSMNRFISPPVPCTAS